jgi:hypothetical protein
MHKLDIVNHIQLFQNDGANQAIEITTRHQTVFLVAQFRAPISFLIQFNSIPLCGHVFSLTRARERENPKLRVFYTALALLANAKT